MSYPRQRDDDDFRISAKNLNGDAIITVDQPIE